MSSDLVMLGLEVVGRVLHFSLVCTICIHPMKLCCLMISYWCRVSFIKIFMLIDDVWYFSLFITCALCLAGSPQYYHSTCLYESIYFALWTVFCALWWWSFDDIETFCPYIIVNVNTISIISVTATRMLWSDLVIYLDSHLCSYNQLQSQIWSNLFLEC